MTTLLAWLRKKHILRGSEPVQCLGCGQCCEAFGGHLRASKADLSRWQELGRTDLLARVNRLGWIWVDPENGQPENHCPFLQRVNDKTAHCSIHEVKPDMCRDYPTLAHEKRCLRGVFLH
ncbi:YkgJ family cysteine cluster protein [Trichloromonas sp.]|uniref:YkgJ family cysteine cluster protein n=1 Tax=Trichloromonas sp. TaxID=3069249 RepID=UPI003D818530